jgi:MYXO-CTERM domain-containing protein
MRSLGTSLALVVTLTPFPAHAALTGEFADALEVNAEFVTGATGATDIAFAADGRAVVTRKNGQITIRNTDGTTEVLSRTFMNVDTGSEKGLLGVVAHPTEQDTLFFYVSDGQSNDDKHRVYQGVLNADNTLTIDTANPIVGADVNPGDPGLEGPANHDGGGLFIHDNHLYVGVGDTGANSTPPSNKYSSCLNKPNGKILRVNLDGTIPDDNPLVGLDAVTACEGTRSGWDTAAPDTRVFAWGFRNPWRFWVDPQGGRMWIGDVGEGAREEISVSEPVEDYSGQHFGYPFHEGSVDYDPLDGLDCNMGFEPGRECTGPVHDYGRADGTSVTGGMIPEGCGWEDAFDGKVYYFFGDYGSGLIGALEVRPDRSGPVSSNAIDAGDLGGGPVSFRQGPGGAMYVVMHGAGSVVEVKPRVQTGDGCQGMGGSGGSSGASGSGGTGGSTASGGSGGGGDEPDDEGCGCRVAGQRSASLAALLAALGLTAGLFARRRAERKRPTERCQ